MLAFYSVTTTVECQSFKLIAHFDYRKTPRKVFSINIFQLDHSLATLHLRVLDHPSLRAMHNVVHDHTTVPDFTSQIAVEVFSRAQLAGCAHWPHSFRAQRKDARYYEVVEDTIHSEFEYGYFVLFDKKARPMQFSRFLSSIRTCSQVPARRSGVPPTLCGSCGRAS